MFPFPLSFRRRKEKGERCERVKNAGERKWTKYRWVAWMECCQLFQRWEITLRLEETFCLSRAATYMKCTRSRKTWGWIGRTCLSLCGNVATNFTTRNERRFWNNASAALLRYTSRLWNYTIELTIDYTIR